ncbi:hypothetical protein MUP00_03755, partial [Candidatus Bathyarchaeota archaeon]|nr:hypothetical protein [Candidatus Bathyarchaeota archaeon]
GLLVAGLEASEQEQAAEAGFLEASELGQAQGSAAAVAVVERARPDGIDDLAWQSFSPCELRGIEDYVRIGGGIWL